MNGISAGPRTGLEMSLSKTEMINMSFTSLCGISKITFRKKNHFLAKKNSSSIMNTRKASSMAQNPRNDFQKKKQQTKRQSDFKSVFL